MWHKNRVTTTKKHIGTLYIQYEYWYGKANQNRHIGKPYIQYELDMGIPTKTEGLCSSS